MDQIKLRNLIDIPSHKNTKDWKIHFACIDKQYGTEPLDDFLNNQEEMARWNESGSGGKRKWHKHIFHLVRFYPERDTWMFVGVYDVHSFDKKNITHDVKLSNDWREYIGRLKINYSLKGRVAHRLLKPIYDDLMVKEVLPIPYEGEEFNGYENVNLSFMKLTQIIKDQGTNSWKRALENMNGIYLITDYKNGKQYVGSAFGDYGLWGRWRDYVDTYHGGNKKLIDLRKKNGVTYFKQNLHFSLLETIPKSNSSYILDRETHWKNILQTRKHGYNEN